MNAAGSRIDGIDRLRAFAMLAVVTQHCGMLPFGWMGVWLFYVISGYVITSGIVQRESAGGSFTHRYGRFMLLRVSRIFPALAAYLLLCVVVAAVFGIPIAAALPSLAGFVFNWWMIFLPADAPPVWGPLGHLWTISVEQQFYVFFPLIAMAAPARMRVPLCAVLIVISPLLRWLTSASLQAANPGGEFAFAIYASTYCHAGAFLMGALIAYRQDDAVRATGAWRWLGAAALVSIVAYAGTYLAVNAALGSRGIALFRNVVSGILYGQWREVFVYIPVVLGSAWLVTRALRPDDAPSSRLRTALAWVGRVSYSGYLVHALVLWLLHRAAGATPLRELAPLTWLLFYAAVVGVTLAVSALMYRWVEQPFIALARRVLRRFEGNSAKPAVPAGPGQS